MLLIAAALLIFPLPVLGLRVEAFVTGAFLIIGIRNAWDGVLYLAKETLDG